MAWNKGKGTGKPAPKKGTTANGKGKSRNASTSKYTAAQQKAYQVGRGYELGKYGKRINFKNPETEQSFFAGV